MRFGLAFLRAVVGGLFMGHGLQKLAGWFGGHGLDATGAAFEGMGLRPGKAHAAAAGAAETTGGALMVLGLFTPLGASLLSGTMITAIRKVHAANGPWASSGGYEYNLVLVAIVFALSDTGPGPLSLDELLGTRRAGLGWAIAQLAAGAAGSSLAIAIGERPGEPADAVDGSAAAERDGAVPAGDGQPATA